MYRIGTQPEQSFPQSFYPGYPPIYVPQRFPFWHDTGVVNTKGGGPRHIVRPKVKPGGDLYLCFKSPILPLPPICEWLGTTT